MTHCNRCRITYIMEDKYECSNDMCECHEVEKEKLAEMELDRI